MLVTTHIYTWCVCVIVCRLYKTLPPIERPTPVCVRLRERDQVKTAESERKKWKDVMVKKDGERQKREGWIGANDCQTREKISTAMNKHETAQPTLISPLYLSWIHINVVVCRLDLVSPNQCVILEMFNSNSFDVLKTDSPNVKLRHCMMLSIFGK